MFQALGSSVNIALWFPFISTASQDTKAHILVGGCGLYIITYNPPATSSLVPQNPDSPSDASQQGMDHLAPPQKKVMFHISEVGSSESLASVGNERTGS